MWIEFIKRHHLKTVAEVRVARGEMALALLEGCPEIASYYLIDLPHRPVEASGLLEQACQQGRCWV
jgi:hypothetical protein